MRYRFHSDCIATHQENWRVASCLWERQYKAITKDMCILAIMTLQLSCLIRNNAFSVSKKQGEFSIFELF